MSIPAESKTIILQRAPVTDVDLDWNSPTATFKIEKLPIPQLKQGEVLVKSLYFSNDASQRAYIQKGVTEDQMYTRPVFEGEPMKSFGLGEVAKSENPEYAVGDIVNCVFSWAEYTVVKPEGIFNKVPKGPFPLTAFLDYLGSTSLTAYFGLHNVAKLKAGETIVVSGAAGATGSMVVQIAKVIGAKVIGIAGGPEKCKFIESIGADVSVDYKDPQFAKKLLAACAESKPEVVWDGVGGSVLDVMLLGCKNNARVVACGSIAGYNDKSKSNMQTWGLITVKRLSVLGFIVIDYLHDAASAVGNLIQWVQEGKIKADDTTFSLVDKSNAFEDIPKVWFTLYNGEKAPGKLITKVSEPKL